jgi:toxin ParE1/3/4
MKVRLDEQARRDLIDIRTSLRRHASPAAGERVHSHLRSRIKGLGKHPYIGTRASEPDVRVLAPSRYPYRIYYTVTHDAVIILHVRHTARREPDLSRL